MWIYSFHSSKIINENFDLCLNNAYWPWSIAMMTGDLGVDAFFVISGFLIAHILLKEIEKLGHIEILSFYRSRILRLWPALCSAIIC